MNFLHYPRLNCFYYFFLFAPLVGIVVDNKSVAQPILTTDGVLSHVASVLSGGSAINMAIVIEETEDYFDFLEKKFPGVSFDRKKLDEVRKENIEGNQLACLSRWE